MATSESLYLEGNELVRLPEHLFSSLPSLVWLDLRNNKLRSLPAGVGQHRCLQPLLLEGNPINELHRELCNLITLKALSLRNCPLMFPPQAVVDHGLAKILHYLRDATTDRHISSQLDVMEKLQLSDLGHFSLDLSEDEADDTEVQRFHELRHRIVHMKRIDLGFSAPAPPRTEESDHSSCPPSAADH